MSSPAPFLTCAACHGLSPVTRTACVHCDAALSPPGLSRGAGRGSGLAGALGRALGRAAIAGGALVTLMACYGMIAHPVDGRYANCGGDVDRDGVCVETDCDDTRADVFPGAADPDLDGIDQNCDGVDGWRDPATVAAPVPGDGTPPADPPADPAADPTVAPPPPPGGVIATDPPADPP